MLNFGEEKKGDDSYLVMKIKKDELVVAFFSSSLYPFHQHTSEAPVVKLL
jgi:hypothetical protein